MALTLQSWISRTLSRPRTRLRLELPLSITWPVTQPMAHSTRCASTGSTRGREFPTWTRCWAPALLRTETAGHLQILDRLLTAASRTIRLIGLIESARGLAAVEAIATATPRLVGLMMGAADMAADLGATTAWEPLAYARSRLIAACALADVTPIDSPFFDIHNE